MGGKRPESLVYIYTLWVFGCFGVCLYVRLYPIDVQMAKPICPNFCVGPHMTPGKVYGCLKLQQQQIVQKNLFLLNLENTLNT